MGWFFRAAFAVAMLAAGVSALDGVAHLDRHAIDRFDPSWAPSAQANALERLELAARAAAPWHVFAWASTIAVLSAIGITLVGLAPNRPSGAPTARSLRSGDDRVGRWLAALGRSPPPGPGAGNAAAEFDAQSFFDQVFPDAAGPVRRHAPPPRKGEPPVTNVPPPVPPRP